MANYLLKSVWAITVATLSACSPLNSSTTFNAQASSVHPVIYPDRPAVLRKGLYITDKKITASCPLSATKPVEQTTLNPAKIGEEPIEPSTQSVVLENGETPDKSQFLLKEVLVPILLAVISKS